MQGDPHVRFDERSVEPGATVRLVRHRQTKEAATDRPSLKPPAPHSDSTATKLMPLYRMVSGISHVCVMRKSAQFRQSCQFNSYPVPKSAVVAEAYRLPDAERARRCWRPVPQWGSNSLFSAAPISVLL